MSEQKQSYMSQLDDWTHQVIVDRLFGAWQDYSQASKSASGFSEAEAEEVLNRALSEVKKAVREKVLESFKAGLAVVPARRSNQVIAAIERKAGFRPQKQK